MAFQIGIADDEAFEREILQTQGMVQVVECHKEWCGPCKAIVSTFRRMSLDLGDRPLKFYTVVPKTFSILSFLQANVDQIEALNDYRDSCKPVFLIYKARLRQTRFLQRRLQDGEMRVRVAGVGPELSKEILSCLTA